MEMGMVPKPATCVWCEAARPEQGKLLACLHVVCPSCLRDVQSKDRSVKCPMCWEITACPPGHRDLQQLLEDAAPLMYGGDAESNNSNTAAPAAAPLPPAPPRKQETRTCEFCEEAAAESATHSCRFCVPAALLCDAHAQGHAKSRRFQEHVVIRLAQPGGSTAEATAAAEQQQQQPMPMCPVHGGRAVSSYCHTCRVLLCDMCRPALHTAHRVLGVAESAAAAREKVRRALTSAAASTPPRSRANSDEVEPSPLAAPARRSASVGKRPVAAAVASIDGTHMLRKNVASSLKELSRAIESIGEEAEAASEHVCAQVKRLEELLRRKQDELLQHVEQKRWKQQQAVEERAARLQSIQQQFTVAEILGAALLRSDAQDVSVLRLSANVVNRLDACRAALSTELSRTQPLLPPLSGRVNATAMSQIEAQISELAYVDHVIDLNCSKLKLPARVCVGMQCRASLHLYASNGAPISLAYDFKSVSAYVEPPSGRSSAAALALLATTVPTATLEMTFRVEEAGVHWVLIGDGEGSLVKTSFDVLDRASQSIPERKHK